MEPFTLKVANTTRASALAKVLCYYAEAGKEVRLACLGAVATYTALKSIINANRVLMETGNVLYTLPTVELQPAIYPQTEGEHKYLIVLSLRKVPL